MCGILFSILDDETISNETLGYLERLIDKRGPDFQSPSSLHELRCGLRIRLKASVLHLRGHDLQQQPAIDEFGNILLFNGQIYQFDGATLPEELSDTSFLLEQLKTCRSKVEVAEIFSHLDGPFAFIYLRQQEIWFGRDFFGRKSLCVSQRNPDSIPDCISSVSRRNLKATEVNCSRFHCLDFSQNLPRWTGFMWNIDRIYPSLQSSIHDDNDIENMFLEKIPLAPLNNDLRLPNDFTPEDMNEAVEGLEEKLIQAVSIRIKFNRQTCLQCRRDLKCEQYKVLETSETIDLLTVAFKDGSPDRKSVGSAFRELRELCPSRNWRLVLSDITRPTLQQLRDEIISDLIAPCNTVVDDSLGCGCWFISRGHGRSLDSSMIDEEFEKIFDDFLEYNPTNDECDNQEYTSPATMFFAGMGIDEQLGGYSSHRAAWSKAGTKGIFDEISLQMRRISWRNLGRDDRCYSHHGRDVKLPYLDYDLVSYLNQLPIGLKMNLDEPMEVGPKKLLRMLALRWGLKETSKRVKRALQFGTRIANLEQPKERGNEVCSRLT